MKKEKKSKFQLEKFNVAKLNNLKAIRGGQVNPEKETIDLTVILAGGAGGSTNNCSE